MRVSAILLREDVWGDGCGGSCGTCSGADTCKAGQCVCQPTCFGMECGVDGCGGYCGSCSGGAACINGLCSTSLPDCVEVIGTCLGDTLPLPPETACELLGEGPCIDLIAQAYATGGCGEECNGLTFPGLDALCGSPVCEGLKAQLSGVGLITDQCETCFCTPKCGGATCGDDGCGGSCGTCASGSSCSGGQCQPDAAGCGGVTFEGCCAGGTLKYCEGDNLVTGDCPDPATCGWDSNAGFYNCDTAGGADPSGVHPKECTGPCVPQCSGKTCGSDGCGGSCGTCSGGMVCSAGQCTAPPQGCGSITYEGCCTGDKLKYCETSELKSLDCPAGTCGWSDAGGFYDCNTEGKADPTGANPLSCP